MEYFRYQDKYPLKKWGPFLEMLKGENEKRVLDEARGIDFFGKTLEMFNALPDDIGDRVDFNLKSYAIKATINEERSKNSSKNKKEFHEPLLEEGSAELDNGDVSLDSSLNDKDKKSLNAAVIVETSECVISKVDFENNLLELQRLRKTYKRIGMDPVIMFYNALCGVVHATKMLSNIKDTHLVDVIQELCSYKAEEEGYLKKRLKELIDE